VESFVEVSELWLLSTGGDRTVVQDAGANALPIQLPDSFSNLRFGDAVSPDQFTLTEDGFVLHEPIRPGEPLELVFTFMLPYERSLEFTQPIDFPVQAAVLLTQSDAPELQGQGVEDLGERDMGGILLHSYAMTGLEAGENLTLTLRGAHPLKPPGFSTSNLAVGLGVFGMVLIVVGIIWWGWQRKANELVTGLAQVEDPGSSRAELLQGIAALDDAFEAGKIEESAYTKRRAALKSRLMEQIQDDDD
jgi:hypothetical protein